MRIWFVNHYAYAPDQSAGTRHFNLSRELIKLGHEPLIIASSFYHKSRVETRLADGEQFRRTMIDGVPFHYIRTPPYGAGQIGRAWNMLAFARAVRNGVGLKSDAPPDVIVGSMPSPFAAIAAERLARRFNAMYLAEIRDYWSAAIRDLGGYGKLNPFIVLARAAEAAAIRRAKKVICVFPRPADEYFALGGKRENFVSIPNGVALHDVPDPAGYDGVWDQTPFVVTYAGAHGTYNGLEYVLEAAALLERKGITRAQMVIRLIGDGPVKPALKLQAQSLGITIVDFVDAIPKSDIYSALLTAHAFLMPLRRIESLQAGISPNKLWDYMACARPVIFQVETDVNPVAQSHSGITVEIEKAEPLADALLTLLHTPRSELREMGARGRAYIAERYGFDSLTRRLLAVIKGTPVEPWA